MGRCGADDPIPPATPQQGQVLRDRPKKLPGMGATSDAARPFDDHIDPSTGTGISYRAWTKDSGMVWIRWSDRLKGHPEADWRNAALTPCDVSDLGCSHEVQAPGFQLRWCSMRFNIWTRPIPPGESQNKCSLPLPTGGKLSFEQFGKPFVVCRDNELTFDSYESTEIRKRQDVYIIHRLQWIVEAQKRQRSFTRGPAKAQKVGKCCDIRLRGREDERWIGFDFQRGISNHWFRCSFSSIHLVIEIELCE